MYKIKLKEKRTGFWVFGQQSIQRKLPFLIFLLLLAVILAFSWLSFMGIKKSSVDAGNLRLKSLSEQLSTMFAQSTQSFITATRTEANKSSVKKYLLTEGKDSVDKTKEILEKLRTDSTWVLVELLNKKKEIVLRSGDNWKKPTETANPLDLSTQIHIDTGKVGKIYVKDDRLYYPVEVAVTDGEEIIGYLIRWRRMQTTQQAIDRFTQLLGLGVNLYVGNTDGSVWTDLKKQVTFLPSKIDSANEFSAYARTGGGNFFAATTPVKNTEWTVLVELSQEEVKAPAFRFLRIALTSGIILIAIGIFLTWLLSRSITRPLEKLTVAAAQMASGNFHAKVNVDRNDELGVLANSFNKMAHEVEQSQKNLETKVKERTAQLEAANKELEAFSYSVSHDLRTPLRAIDGYAMILKEDYGAGFDREGNRVLDQVILYAHMMGQLIDDLIAFSKISKKEGNYQLTNMKKLAEESYHEILQHNAASNARLQIMNIPSCYADENLMKQVWINLISNAVKYSSKTTDPVIEIGSRIETDRIVYYIKDNGVGFEMKYADKLFGVFQRLHGQDEFEGTGIGLALVKRIVDKQGGTIWAEAELNKGATFYFSMPLQENNQSTLLEN